MRRLFFLFLVLTIGFVLIPTQFALAAPCLGSCGDEATCGGTACGDNECPCDTEGTCICVDNKCQCPAPCNGEKGCSSDCPTKDACRPAIASADIDNQDNAADQEDGTSGINEQIKDTDDSGKDDGDKSGDDTNEGQGDEGLAKEAASVEDSDSEDSGSSTLLYVAIAILGAGTIGGGFLIFGRQKKDQNEN